MFGFKKYLGRLLAFLGFKKFKEKETKSRCIICISDGIQDWFILWSMVLKAPLSKGMYRSTFTSWYIRVFPNTEEVELDRCLDEAYASTSNLPSPLTLDEILKDNKAGFKRETFTKEQIIRHYCESESTVISKYQSLLEDKSNGAK